MIAGSDTCGHEVGKVTGAIVKEAACKMKAGKGDVSNGYTSDAILNAPDILFDQLSLVYRSWLVHGTACLCFPSLTQKQSEKSL